MTEPLPTKPLQIVSYLAPNMLWFYEAVGAYLERTLNIEIQVVQSQFDPLEDPKIRQDKVDVAFICGLPLVRYSSIAPGKLQILVAPVMQAERYQNCPVYFSDVIVSTTSGITNFAQLAGKTLCYNDPGSNSGYNLLRHRLLEGGYSKNFFGKVIQSGSHQRSIEWVTGGLADCAAIDSTVLEQELRHFPQLSQQLRVLESIGPCPIPPVVAAQRLGAVLLDQLRIALLQPDLGLQSLMQKAGVQRFAAVNLVDYEAIAQIYDSTLQAGYQTLS